MLLIITGCISVDGSTPYVAVRSTGDRLKSYINTVKWAFNSGTFTDVVFCDNSGYELDTEELSQEAREKNINFEYMTFKGDVEKVNALGKGYGEGEIIQHVLSDSRVLKAYKGTHFCKITGRLTVSNVDRLIPKHGKLCQAYFMNKKKRPEVDTRFYCCSLDFYKDKLSHCHERVDDSKRYYLEKSFYDALHGVERYHMFMQRPMFNGVSGTMGVEYKYKRGRFEFLIDILCRTNLYNSDLLRRTAKKK